MNTRDRALVAGLIGGFLGGVCVVGILTSPPFLWNFRDFGVFLAVPAGVAWIYVLIHWKMLEAKPEVAQP